MQYKNGPDQQRLQKALQLFGRSDVWSTGRVNLDAYADVIQTVIRMISLPCRNWLVIIVVTLLCYQSSQNCSQLLYSSQQYNRLIGSIAKKIKSFTSLLQELRFHQKKICLKNDKGPCLQEKSIQYQGDHFISTFSKREKLEKE